MIEQSIFKIRIKFIKNLKNKKSSVFIKYGLLKLFMVDYSVFLALVVSFRVSFIKV
ncbi:branched-chain amino acid aminotransferase I [Helicobacter pylori]|nr:branched-chain amino acid aminotransferase I [Helicobacter pylori]